MKKILQFLKEKILLDKKSAQEKAEKLKAEAAVNDARAKEIAAKNTPEVEEAPAARGSSSN